MAKANTSKANVYEMVTNTILAQLEQGKIPWEKPWIGTGFDAYNRVTGRSYSLLNQIMLGMGGEWASFAQWTAAGAKVRKGEKSSQVVFWKLYEVEKTDKDTGETYTDKIPVLKYSNVFHISQVEPIFEDKPIVAKREENDEVINNDQRIMTGDEAISMYMDREGIKFVEQACDTAFYSSTHDIINVPNFEQFKNAPEYYSTTFHEIVHSTGHKDRLNRLKPTRYGTQAYSFEELVAEMGSAMIMAQLEIDTEHTIRNSAGYIQSWISLLKSDEKAFVKAASLAEKASKFVFNGKEKAEAVEEPKAEAVVSADAVAEKAKSSKASKGAKKTGSKTGTKRTRTKKTVDDSKAEASA